MSPALPTYYGASAERCIGIVKGHIEPVEAEIVQTILHSLSRILLPITWLPFTCAVTITLLKTIFTVTNHPYKILYDKITNVISMETVQNKVYT